ncbi:MAG: prepilin-type N-terminal cleavage/methylation domain-containing protein [Chromatiaceae bacterium]|nr:prepilin-type N-terminal cleavage/methylation domain-containing protein [Chromatiaceae bacterium]
MNRIACRPETRPQGRVSGLLWAQSGYTVIELAVVIVLLGIVAANAMPRFFTASRFEALGFTDAVVAAASYAQKVALATRCDTRLHVTATGYQLLQRQIDCTAGAFTRAVVQPGGGNWSGTAPAGVAVGGLDVYFDSQGRPHDASSGTLLSAPQTVSIGARNVTVEHTTGYVHAG